MEPSFSPQSKLDTDIQFVKGVGPRLAAPFKKLGIHTLGDLLQHYPRRYEDRRHLPALRSLRVGTPTTVRGRVVHVDSRSTRSRMTMVSVVLHDGTGQVTLTWFNQPWLAKKFREVTGDVIAYGVVKQGPQGYEISAPEYEFMEPEDSVDEFASIIPIYPSTEGLNQKTIRRAIQTALQEISLIEDPFSDSFRESYHLPELQEALRQLHRPTDENATEKARRRIVFDELFATQLLVQLRRVKSQQEPGISFPISKPETLAGVHSLFAVDKEEQPKSMMEAVQALLPFKLTGAQDRVIREIWKDMERPVPMNRLVQGDVGSGKTAVAAAAMLAAVRCGMQAALMAPTEILAEQHAIGLKRLFEPAGIHVEFLAGKLNSKQTKKALDALANGSAHIAVGTHSLIQDAVRFHKLGLVVIDEQHRFGVLQRVALRQKAERIPDVLVMTATPIPRTLAMTVYGDLDVSIINELPPGRKPIRTYWKRTDQRPEVYASVKKLLERGTQAYFVCPAIEESEKLQTQAAKDLHFRLSTQEFEEYRVGLLHGQMKSVEKEEVMEQFRKHELDILVATVVIEVGVDVPNASVIVIEDANRFGLSQLHQIRGRVGRGNAQSFCILIANATTEDAQQRMEVMVETSDGFKISEADLNLRGPGNMLGTEQSGMVNFKLADLVRDFVTLEQARKAAQRVAESDPDLVQPENQRLTKLIADRLTDEGWIAVS